eukprot:scaffold26037_cov73-Phaeocystis_antarctica.AAC.2
MQWSTRALNVLNALAFSASEGASFDAASCSTLQLQRCFGTCKSARCSPSAFALLVPVPAETPSPASSAFTSTKSPHCTAATKAEASSSGSASGCPVSCFQFLSCFAAAPGGSSAHTRPKHLSRNEGSSASCCGLAASAQPSFRPEGTRNELVGTSLLTTCTGTRPRSATTTPFVRSVKSTGMLPTHAGSEETTKRVLPAAFVISRLTIGRSSCPRHSTKSPGCGRVVPGQTFIHSPRSALRLSGGGPEPPPPPTDSENMSVLRFINSCPTDPWKPLGHPWITSSSTSTLPNTLSPPPCTDPPPPPSTATAPACTVLTTSELMTHSLSLSGSRYLQSSPGLGANCPQAGWLGRATSAKTATDGLPFAVGFSMLALCRTTPW